MPRVLPLVCVLFLAGSALGQESKVRYLAPINIEPPPIASDKSVKYDYDIVYVRAPRKDPTGRSRWAEVGDPRTMEAGADLVLLHPDGKEEVLVPVTGNESIADPYVSFDGKSVFFAKFHDVKTHKGSDLYKIHVPTRKLVPLTNQTFTPN
ncbi:MAG TPA: hypothetical protein VHR72_04635, partial [Gemmataceae bacterium]|nr:hypothetical protein [Gemmataceae bacterium]